MKVSDIEEKIKADKAEIAAIEVEKEDVVCKSYNVYNKKEIIDIINEEISSLEKELEEAELEEEREKFTFGLDPAFQSWEQVNRMFV